MKILGINFKKDSRQIEIDHRLAKGGVIRNAKWEGT